MHTWVTTSLWKTYTPNSWLINTRCSFPRRRITITIWNRSSGGRRTRILWKLITMRRKKEGIFAHLSSPLWCISTIPRLGWAILGISPILILCTAWWPCWRGIRRYLIKLGNFILQRNKFVSMKRDKFEFGSIVTWARIIRKCIHRNMQILNLMKKNRW